MSKLPAGSFFLADDNSLQLSVGWLAVIVTIMHMTNADILGDVPRLDLGIFLVFSFLSA